MSSRQLMFWGSEQILHSVTQRNSTDGQRSWLKLGSGAQMVVVKVWRGLNLRCHKHSPDRIMHARFQEGNQTDTIHDRPKLTCQPQRCRLLITQSLKFIPSNQILLEREGQSVLGCRFLFHISDHGGWVGWCWHNRKGICCRRINGCGRGDCSLSETCVEVRSMEWVWEHDYFCMRHRSG